MVAVYSGSFNPLHIGHLAILKRLDEMFEEVLLVVSPKNPLKEGISVDSGGERFEAAVAAVGRHPELKNVRVSDIELKMEPPNYTISTLDALHKAEPHKRFVLTVGGDQIADFRRWKDWERILSEYGIVVFPREGFDAIAEAASLLNDCPDASITIVDAPLVNVSSTQIRNAIANGDDVSSLLM